MKEKIILAPGADPAELQRTLARYGVGSLGLRVMGGSELARLALMRSGVCVTETFLPSSEIPALIYSFLREIPYFARASFSDAEDLAKALNTARKLVPDDEGPRMREILMKGEFAEKNEAILRVCERYISACGQLGRIDAITLMRRALTSAEPFDAEFLYLKEFQLLPLETRLLEHLSKGACRPADLPALFCKEPQAPKILRFSAGFGAVNEAESIIGRIFSEGLPLDDCLIACPAEDLYTQLFYDLSQRFCIPVTFGSGIPIGNAFPAALLRLLYRWNTAGFNGIDALSDVIFSPAFDRQKLVRRMGGELRQQKLRGLAAFAGSLRISFDAKANRERLDAVSGAIAPEEKELLEMTRVLAGELEAGYASFLENYAVSRPGSWERIDQSALSVICASLRAYESFAADGEPEDIIPDLLKKTVSSESSKEGMLHICSIPAALSAMRGHLFVCGLSSAAFPGTPAEDHLLLDSDIALFGQDPLPASSRRIEMKKTALRDLLSLAAALDAKTMLSYPEQDLAAIKEQNPSSVLFDIYEQTAPGGGIDGFKAVIERDGYFAAGLSGSDYAGRQYNRGNAIEGMPDAQTRPDSAALLSGDWSPTGIEIFFQCPRRFYLTNVCGLKEEEEDDPFTVLDGRMGGNLAHTAMQALADPSLGKDEFLRLCGQLFDDHLKRRPPLHAEAAVRERTEFLSMMGRAFDEDPRSKVLAAEEKLRFTHPSGITIKGRPDRVEETAGGSYLIVDFKTQRKRTHEPDDIDSCLQVVLYAWLCRQAGIPVSRCEYRYLRKYLTVSCVIDDEMLQKLDGKLRVFKAALENNDFPRVPGKKDENCRYCGMADVCLWPDDERKEADDDEE